MHDQEFDQATVDDNFRSLVQELKARQSELERQNQELRRAQAELADSRDRYSDLYDFAPVGYITLDSDGIIRSANLSAVDLLELNRRQLVGSDFSKFVPAAGQEVWRKHRLKTVATLDQQTCQLPLRTCLGESLWVRLESTSVSDPSASGTNIRTAIINETEYRRAQELIREKDERLTAFLDNSDVLAWMKDAKGRYVFMSRNFQRRFDLKLADNLGKTDFDIWPRELAEQFRKNDALVLERGCAIEALEEAIDPNGSSSWWSSHKFSFIDSEEYHYVGGMAVNMTEREQALKELQQLNIELERRVSERTAEADLRATELQESQERLRRILDAAPDAIISMDDQGIIRDVNPATERIFGYVSSELIGQKIQQLVPSYKSVQSADDFIVPREPIAQRKDGAVFPIDIKTNQLNSTNLVVAIIRDISAKKILEKQVIDSATDQQRRIGHDIHDGVGQELTGLRYMAQTHAESLQAASSADAATAQRMCTWLETIQTQMRGIIRQLVPVEVDQLGLVAALKGLADHTAELHHVNCVFQCEHRLTVTDPGLATQLFRIVQEAVNNAVRHSQANLIKILVTESNGKLGVFVVDNGIGMISSSQRGIGIGMNTMAYRAGLINAQLTIEPADQHGTAVKCLIPNNTDFSLFNVLSNQRYEDERHESNRSGDNQCDDC